MTYRTVFILIFIIFNNVCLGQKEWSNWYFSPNHVLTFKNGPAALQGNFIPPPYDWRSYLYNQYPGTSYSDPVTGQMKFLAAGRWLYDKNYNLIEKSFDLRACPGDKYSFHIIPFVNNPEKFYIIQHQSSYADVLAQQSGLQVRCPNAIGLGYSILDLSLNNGLGDLTSINNQLLSGTAEGIALIRHANGKDVWVVVHKWGNNSYYAYLFTDNGVSSPVITPIGAPLPSGLPDVAGHIISTHNGKLIASQLAEKNVIELYDFDNSTGKLSNLKKLNVPAPAYHMIFSPDDSKLYTVGVPGILQFDFNAADIQQSMIKIAEDPNSNYGDMQIGLDGRIYLSAAYDIADGKSYMPIISCPNLPKYAANYKKKGMEGGLQFPKFINDFIVQPKAPRVTEFSIGNDTAICFGTFRLAAPEGWQHYRWNTGETTREITISTPGLYYVLAGDEGFSCPTAFGSITITNAARQLNLGKDTVLCPALTYNLDVPANFSNLLWNDGSSLQNRVITKSGKYSLTATDESGCTNWDTISIGYKFEPRVNFGTDTTLCERQTLLLQMDPRPNPFWPSGTFLWQNGSVKDTFRVTQPGLYWGKATFQGCTVTDTVRVSYIRSAGLNLGADTTLCVGDSLVLNTQMTTANIIWSTGETTAAIAVRNNGKYSVRANNGTCTITDTINVTFNPRPTIFLGNDTALCEKNNLILKATSSSGSYQWQDGSVKNFFEVTQDGQYWIKVTQAGCSVYDTILVSYNPLPKIDLGNDTGICINQSLILNAQSTEAQRYEWQDGSTGSSFVVGSAGKYTVRITGNNGCIYKDSVSVTTHPLPQFSLGKDTVLCEQQVLRLALSFPGAQYKWNTGSQSNTFTIAQPGSYWLDISQNGCHSIDSLNVYFKPLPNVNLGSDTTLCEGQTKLLELTQPGATYRWQDQSNGQRYMVSRPGIYHATVNLDGCIKKDSILIRYDYKPVFTLGNDTSLCTGQEIILDPKISNSSFRWQNGATSRTYVVKEAGVYKLSATNHCGSSADEIIISKGLCKLNIPNAFSPNKDGVNDIFRVPDPAFIKTFYMEIYNRWGELIFKTENPYLGWNGKYKGNDQPEGNYVFQIRLTTREGDVEYKKGAFFLLR